MMTNLETSYRSASKSFSSSLMLGYFKSFSSDIHSKYSVQSRSSFQTNGWQCFDAKSKSSGEQVTVWVLEKKSLTEYFAQAGVKSKSSMVSEVWDFATKGVQKLTKIRHPSVLKIVEPLEPHKNSLIFVSEKVQSTLSLAKDLDELSILSGLSSIIEALKFLHNQVGSVHCNLTPNSVLIDAQGDWKLAGFEFLVKYGDYSAGEYFLPQLDPRMPAFVHPAYSYLAPELVTKNTVCPANDTWSLGCIIYTVYTQKPPMTLGSNPSIYQEELQLFLQKLKTSLHKLPDSLKPYLASLFCVDSEGRISLEVFENSEFMQNPLVKSLRALDEYDAKPVEEKLSFLNHFVTLLPQYPKQMRIRKILKFAVQQLNGPRDPTTGKQVGDVLFKVCCDMSKLSFQDRVLPLFAKLADYTAFQDSVSTNLEVISKTTSDSDFSKHVIPVLVNILKHTDSAQYVDLQIRVLRDVQLYQQNLTVPRIEQVFFPAVIDCFSATPDRLVKVSSANCLETLIQLGLSKVIITDRLIPALQSMKTRDPMVVENVANLWRSICVKLNSEQIFTLAVPTMLELSLAKQLTVHQFKNLITQIREQIESVEKSQLKLLVNNMPEDKDAIFKETSSVPNTVTPGGLTNTTTTPQITPAPVVPTAPTTDFQSFSSFSSPQQPSTASLATTGQSRPVKPAASVPKPKPEPVFDLLDAPQPAKPTQPATQNISSLNSLSLSPKPAQSSFSDFQSAPVTAHQSQPQSNTLNPTPTTFTPALTTPAMNTTQTQTSANILQPTKPAFPMTPLIPNSNKFTPLQPQKPSNDEFGSFVSNDDGGSLI